MSRLPPHQLDAKLRGARLLVWVVGGVIAATYFRTQILDHGKYELQSETNRLRLIALPAPRGVITDRHGTVIAENVPGYTVALLPAPEPELRRTLQRIAPLVHLDAAGIERVLLRYRRAPYQPAVVLSDAPFDVVSALEERRLTLPGLVIQTEPKRHYPDSTAVAHLVGIVGEVTDQDLAARQGSALRLGLARRQGRPGARVRRHAARVRRRAVRRGQRAGVRRARGGCGADVAARGRRHAAHDDRPRPAALCRPDLPAPGCAARWSPWTRPPARSWRCTAPPGTTPTRSWAASLPSTGARSSRTTRTRCSTAPSRRATRRDPPGSSPSRPWR